jgi:hypothetical protein
MLRHGDGTTANMLVPHFGGGSRRGTRSSATAGVTGAQPTRSSAPRARFDLLVEAFDTRNLAYGP